MRGLTIVLVLLMLPLPAGASELLDRFERALEGGAGPCLSTELLELHGRWSELSTAEQHTIDAATSPLYRGRVAAGAPSWLDGDPWAEGEERIPCFPASAIAPNGQAYAHSLGSEHFLLHWNNDGMTTEPEAERLLELLEESLAIQVTDMGYRSPEGLDTYQMVVAVEPLTGLGGYASAVPCEGRWIPFVVINASLIQDQEDSYLAEVVAHELFHTIQYAYGRAEFIEGASETPNRWWLEASASYQQGLVVPEGQQYLQSFSSNWSTAPWLSMETHNQEGHQYGMFVWPLSIEAELGDAGFHWDLWQQLDGRSGYRMQDEFEALLAGRGSGFVEQWAAFLGRGAEGDFPRYEFLLGIRDLNLFAGLPNSTAAEYGALDLPVEGALLAGEAEAPEHLGASFVWFGASQAEDGKALHMHFEGDAEVDGEAVEWVVAFAAVRSAVVVETFHPQPALVSGADGERWEAHVRLDGFHEEYDGVHMAASPVSDFGGGSAGWSWAAEMHSGSGEGGFSEVGGGRGCTQSCQNSSIQSAQAGGLLLLLPLLGLRRWTRV